MTLPFDELNSIMARLEEEASEITPSGVKRYDPKKCCDIILDYLIYCYVMGVDNVNEMLSTSIAVNSDEMREVLYRRIEGKNFEERVREYAEASQNAAGTTENPTPGGETSRSEEVAAENETRPNGGFSGAEEEQSDFFGISEVGDLGKILRVAETEGHRILNEAELIAAKKGGAKTKTWITQRDDRVRETHDYLLGETVGIDEVFVTFDGDKARFPGDFENAENNVNCRCVLQVE